jgi:hypothetical protein
MFTIPKESAIVLEFVFLKYRGVINNDRPDTCTGSAKRNSHTYSPDPQPLCGI